MRRLRTSLLVGLATLNLLSPFATAFAGDGGGISHDQYQAQLRAAFFDSSYTLCDADALASSWGKSLDEAKAHIGWKLTEGTAAILEQDLDAARSDALAAGNTCYFHEHNYAYEDAEALAVYWGVGVAEAKARISFKLGHRDLEVLAEELASARAMLERGAEHGEDESHIGADAQTADLEAFFGSKYQYCDAVVLSQFWQTSIEEAKAAIGYKLRNGWTDTLVETMHEATSAAYQNGEFCYVEQGPFSAADLALIAKGMDVELDVAKGRVNDMLRDGQQAELEEELRKLREP